MAGKVNLTAHSEHWRRGGRGVGFRAPSYSKEEKELLEVCRHVGEKVPMKFATVREAFRYLTPDKDGKITRSDVRYFFRAYDIDSATADRIYDLFDTEGTGEADGHAFVSFMRPHIQADMAPDGSPYCTSEASTRASTPNGLPAAVTAAALPGLEREFRAELEIITHKAPMRFSHAREVLRYVDTDYDGQITREELRHFFRAFELSSDAADRLFERLGGSGNVGANYHTFVQLVGPCIDLPGIVSLMRMPAGPLVGSSGTALSGRSTPRPRSLPRAGSKPSSARSSRAPSPGETLESGDSVQRMSLHHSSATPAEPSQQHTPKEPEQRKQEMIPPASVWHSSGRRRPVGAIKERPLTVEEAREERSKHSQAADSARAPGTPVPKARDLVDRERGEGRQSASNRQESADHCRREPSARARPATPRRCNSRFRPRGTQMQVAH